MKSLIPDLTIIKFIQEGGNDEVFVHSSTTFYNTQFHASPGSTITLLSLENGLADIDVYVTRDEDTPALPLRTDVNHVITLNTLANLEEVTEVKVNVKEGPTTYGSNVIKTKDSETIVKPFPA
ncbi:MAG: hypothetical protein AAFR61_08710 [Bacteroidota bacterium]